MAKRGLITDPKVVNLAVELDIPEPYALGLAMALFQYVCQNHPDGYLLVRPGVLARLLRYPGDGEKLWQAFYATGWIDRAPDGNVECFSGWDELGDPGTRRRVRVTASGGPVAPVDRTRVFMEADYQCEMCGSRADLTVDHIIPVAEGGGPDLANLQCLCRSCNSRKGARLEGQP